MPDIELDEHRRIHADMAEQGVGRAVLAIMLAGAWFPVGDFQTDARSRVVLPRFADGLVLNRTGAHC